MFLTSPLIDQAISRFEPFCRPIELCSPEGSLGREGASTVEGIAIFTRDGDARGRAAPTAEGGCPYMDWAMLSKIKTRTDEASVATC
jgi:hypothetical protein